MPKKDEGKTVRIKESQTKYIEKIAAKLDTSFLEALYYIINYHRENSSGEIIKKQTSTVKSTESETESQPKNQLETQQKIQNQSQHLQQIEVPEDALDDVLDNL